MAAGWAVAGGRWTGCWAEETASLGLRPERRSAWRVTECLRWLARTCWLRATHLGFVSAAPRATGSVLGWTSQLAAASGMLSTRGGRGRVRRRGGGWCSERCPERWQQLSQRKRPRRLSERRPMTSPWSNRPPRPPLSRTGPLAHIRYPRAFMIPVRIGCATPLSATVAPSFRFSSFGSGRGQWIGVNREMNGRSKPGRPCWILEFRIGSCTPAPASHPIFGRVFAREVGCWFWQLNFARCCVQSAECSAASSGMREDHATVGCSCDALKTRFLGRGHFQQRRRTGLDWLETGEHAGSAGSWM